STLTLLLPIFAGRIARVPRRFLLGQQLRHAVQLLALLAFGRMFGVFFGLAARFFRGMAALLGLERGLFFFFGALGHALVARLGDGRAFLGPVIGGGLGRFRAGLGFGKHFGAR